MPIDSVVTVTLIFCAFLVFMAAIVYGQRATTGKAAARARRRQ
jgi:hypothetical protein